MKLKMNNLSEDESPNIQAKSNNNSSDPEPEPEPEGPNKDESLTP